MKEIAKNTNSFQLSIFLDSSVSDDGLFYQRPFYLIEVFLLLTEQMR